jgi:hypothetical protein
MLPIHLGLGCTFSEGSAHVALCRALATRWLLRLKSDFDQPADRLRAGGIIRLRRAPTVKGSGWQSYRDNRLLDARAFRLKSARRRAAFTLPSGESPGLCRIVN